MGRAYEFGEFRLETVERQLLRRGQPIPLPPKVFDTLVLLVENAGRLLSKDELMERLWPDTIVEEVSLAQNISQLRKALGEAAGDAQIIQTVAKRGYRFAAPVRGVDGESTTGVKDAAVASADVPSGAREGVLKGKASRWVAVAGVAAIAMIMSFFPWRDSHRVKAIARIQSIAVLPLANLSNDPEQEYFADGITDDLITELARIRALRVISRTSVMQYKGTRKTLPEIARELNVDAVVEGTVSQRNGRLHLTAQLVQANPEQHVWAETYERPLEDAQSAELEVARAIGAAVQATLTPSEQARMRRSRSVHSDANISYLKGRYLWNKRTREGVAQSVSYFQKAIELDHDFSQAYVGLADAYIFEGGWNVVPANEVLPMAETAARRALELDPDNAEGHAALGLIAMNYDWDWAKAEREYLQALALNPNDSISHHWYAEYLGARGRIDEALAELNRAEELDPLSIAIGADRGKILYFGRRYDEAIAQLHKTLQMDPGHEYAYGWLIRSYVRKRTLPEAQAALQDLRRIRGASPDYWTLVALARAGSAPTKPPVRIDSEDFTQQPGRMLLMQIAVGSADETFAWMEKCYLIHSTAMTSLKVNPDYDRLRGDPRFTKYMEGVGLAN